jgi:hypothetical protein
MSMYCKGKPRKDKRKMEKKDNTGIQKRGEDCKMGDKSITVPIYATIIQPP